LFDWLNGLLLMQKELTKEFISEIRELLEAQNTALLNERIADMHPADAAEIIEALPADAGIDFLRLFDGENRADILMELEEDDREKIVSLFSPKQIAEDVIVNLESDDAADLLSELEEERKEEVISQIQDLEQAKDIVDLLNYPEDSAGGLMAKELIKVNLNWSVLTCVREMRRQAEDVEQVHTIYVVDDDSILRGTLSLKKLLTNPTRAKVSDIYSPEVRSVKATLDDEEVASIMQKYDLFVLPVVDDLGRLLGRITVDDVIDVIKEEADKDYQMASGISENVESDDSIALLTRARLPWLMVGLIGGLVGAQVIQVFDIEKNVEMAYFIPLIAAMAGNVGVQSSAIIVQSLANRTGQFSSIVQKLAKELGVGLLNGLILSTLLFAFNFFFGLKIELATTVSLALFVVIIFAALFGTFVPLLLDKYKVDPALATGPFITTMNDVIGLMIYFYIGKLLIGF
jgi:magnesium transporter